MAHEDFGILKRVNPRDVWSHEATQFTPWLRDNISLIANALGLELDLVEREVPIGDFSADLVAKDLNTDRWVIIENQLDATDHKHLGQVLTYAANRKGGVIVWVSPEFRDERRQTLEWLNSITDEDTDFFGLQVEVLKIGDSAPAPNFSIIAKPIAWRKQIIRTSAITPKQQSYHDFFESLLLLIKTKAPGMTSAQRVGYSSWLAFSAGRSGFGYAFAFTGNQRFRVELYIDQGNADTNKLAFDLLKKQAQNIETSLNLPLDWDRIDAKQACRISIYYPESAQISDTSEKLSQLQNWAVEVAIRFRDIMTPSIRDLQLGG